MGREQIKLVFQIGTRRRHRQFEGAVIRASSRVCGGCTTSNKVGWWMSDGDQRASVFSGVLEQENCFELEPTCEPRKAKRALRAVKAAIADAAIDWDVDTNWVHVTETAVTGRHFSVPTTAADPASSLAAA